MTDYNLPRKTVDPDESVDERLTDNVAQNILPARYLLKDDDGNIDETPEEMFRRVAIGAAKAEMEFDSSYDNYDKWAEEFETQMKQLRLMPNSPTLFNYGTDNQQGSACFVDNPKDTLESIKETEKEAALIFKSGGGMGYAFSKLRPQGALIESTGGGSSGPVSFMKMYNENCQQVAQGGCVDASARVMTDSGYVKLSEVHDGPPLRQSPNGDARVYTRGGDLDAVVESSDSGTMQTVAIKTESGFDIEVTPNHEILTLGDDGLEFTEARNIDSSSTIILSGADKRTDVRHELAEPPEAHYNSNEPDTYPDFVTDQFAKFVGILKGDGTVDIDNDRVIVTLGNNGNGDSAAADFFESYCSELGISYTENDRSGSGKGDYTDYRINSAPFVEWLQSCGIGNTRTVPEVIYRSPASFESFLAGLTVDGSYVNDANTFNYSTAHESFASEIQDILLACGIHSKITSIDSSNYSARYSDKPQYTVRVSPGSSAHDFEENVNEFLDGFELGRGGERQNQFESPSFIEEVLAEHYTKGHEPPETVDRRSMKELRRFSRGDRTPSLQRLRSLLEDVDINPDSYDALDTENIFESVDSVSDSKSVVCDIENKTGYPEYVASNVVVHNKRRGAQMGIMDVRHPDIGRFCVAKRKEGDLDNFNISIGVRDEFEQAVRNDEMYTLYDPETDFEEPFDLIEATKQFYSPEYADSPEAVVDENIWRDYADTVEAWDWENEQTVSFEEKWSGDDRLSFEVGEPMELPARFIWDVVIDGGWRNGEPGVVHLDEMNREHSYDIEEHPNKEIICTNPCSEQPLEEYESCTLAHVNLSLLVEPEAPTFDEFASVDMMQPMETKDVVEQYFYEAVDFSNFDRTIEAGVRMLDNIVEANEFPIDDLREMADRQRKIGLGLMGFAQMLYQMDIEYGSEESYEMARCVMRHIQQSAAQYSHALAKERGSFENWDKSKYANPTEYDEWFERFTGLPADDHADGFPMRNHNVTTIAPTGTTSMIGDTSGGCEPVYNVMYYKNVGNDIQGASKLVEIDDFFRKTLEANDIDVDEVREEALSYMEPDDETFEGVHQLDTVPDGISDLFVTVNDLTPRQHGIMQRIFQKYNQSGISKTVNLPNGATRADVHDAYLLSIADPSEEPGNRAKGVSLYRDGSRNEQVLSTNATTKNAKGEEILTKAEKLNGELEDAADLLERQQRDEVAELLREVSADA